MADEEKLSAIEAEVNGPAADVLVESLVEEANVLRTAFNAAAERIMSKHITKGSDPETLTSVYTLLLAQSDWRTAVTPEQLKATLLLYQPTALVTLRKRMAARILKAAQEASANE